MTPEEQIQTMSGVSKRLFVALSDFRGSPPQLEDALFQLASVIDSTSKYHYPNENSSKTRFTNYLNSIATDIFRIASSGKAVLVDCTFLGPDGQQHSFGEIIYGIRCSSYHDPNEVNSLIHWGDNNHFGVRDGKFIVNGSILFALFLILLTDEANKEIIDTNLFTDEHYLTVKGVDHPFHEFVGKRDVLLTVLEL